MLFLVATNVVASRRPECRPTGTPHARAKTPHSITFQCKEIGLGHLAAHMKDFIKSGSQIKILKIPQISMNTFFALASPQKTFFTSETQKYSLALKRTIYINLFNKWENPEGCVNICILSTRQKKNL